MAKRNIFVFGTAKRAVSALVFSALVFAMLIVIPTAHAASQECRSLEIQIKAAPKSQSSGKNSAQATRYAKAITAQSAQISKAKSNIRTLGCSGSIITLGSGGEPSCTKLNSALKSMNANLAKLKSQYARLSKGGGVASKRDMLKARYQAAGCGGADGQNIISVNTNPKSNMIAILGDTKAKRESDERAMRKRLAANLPVPGLSFSDEAFRTLCVRKCDGYYFPISFSTTRENFKRDTVACQRMCGGTEVELFMHKVPDEESEDMVTENGEPYKAMSYAFAYRREGIAADSSCRCQAVQGVTILNTGEAGSSGIAGIDGSGGNESSDPMAASDSVPVPRPRADALDGVMFDRESMADAAGDLTDADIVEIFEPKVAETNPDGSIRVVGPVFLPAPSEAIDLKAPARPLFR